MLRTRIIPVLLLRNESLVKTRRFDRFTYIGDPCNTVRIFNELEVDELAFLDITATRNGQPPNMKILREIANECFMPLSYGGGIRSVDETQDILSAGFEKVIVNTAAFERPELVTELSDHFGSQAVVGSIDVKQKWRGARTVRIRSGRTDTGVDPVVWAKQLERCGAGEILLTSIDREGTWSGYDLDLISSVARAVTVPVIAHGGARSAADFHVAVEKAGASAVATGSMVVFQKEGMGVLVNLPPAEELAALRGLA